jgi:hypothetical protein
VHVILNDFIALLLLLCSSHMARDYRLCSSL